MKKRSRIASRIIELSCARALDFADLFSSLLSPSSTQRFLQPLPFPSINRISIKSRLCLIDLQPGRSSSHKRSTQKRTKKCFFSSSGQNAGLGRWNDRNAALCSHTRQRRAAVDRFFWPRSSSPRSTPFELRTIDCDVHSSCSVRIAAFDLTGDGYRNPCPYFFSLSS